ncbi:hypothetical protein T4B_13207 [Trichinella pseudospiralis]|uniref:Uncharacterized protein n=1 Tax=Trichinella pseudospiralis TaxID=6337 RepID=A0A0V1GDJ6_TRIPS|nr:hypothetical protein T4A_408 [Trichinella pseudospiralis]KRY95198.1 hypothetical protein T4B_2629 [Trichinella pseudospiralis]KRY96311.1 hypothetical protein T4B_13207 [Trichinella pseudospiralis]KRY98573.1 hypothetical protein T4C_4426 [Trichinella pseudospiralis]
METNNASPQARDRHYYQANTHSDKANADEPS